MSIDRKSLLIALSAYIMWGLFPLFWKLLAAVPTLEILAHRLIWSFVFYVSVASLMGLSSWSGWRVALRKESLFLLVSTALISANWFTYIYAVQVNKVMEGSLAYYLTPLLNVLSGFFLFKERMGVLKWIALALATIGVAVLFWTQSEPPYLALIMAFTFAGYGIIKKKVKAPSLVSNSFESFVAVLCLLIGSWFFGSSVLVQRSDSTMLLLVLGGVITALPLLAFSFGAQRLPLSLMGIFQFIAPSLQFLIAVFIFKEPFDHFRLVAFIAIWTGIVFYLISAVSREPSRSQMP